MHHWSVVRFYNILKTSYSVNVQVCETINTFELSSRVLFVFFHFILLPEIFCKRLNLIHQGREIFTHILYPHTAVLLLFYAMPEIIIMGSYCNCYSFNWHKKQQWGQRIPLFISSIYFIVSYSR